MNKFQPVNFTGLDDLFAFLPKNELDILKALRSLILECMPNVKEKLSYNVPYYSINKRICFIWPGSVPWGGTREGVLFGFTNAKQLTDEWNYLEWGERKTVGTKTYLNAVQVLNDTDIIKTLLFEAAEADARSKKRKV
ncbi:MAG: DUF1801 domain-containing protein [Bacteroidia bacterium]|nr:DUF1801 domain-containing protein [Bacteroidia bacterium]